MNRESVVKERIFRKKNKKVLSARTPMIKKNNNIIEKKFGQNNNSEKTKLVEKKGTNHSSQSPDKGPLMRIATNNGDTPLKQNNNFEEKPLNNNINLDGGTF